MHSDPASPSPPLPTLSTVTTTLEIDTFCQQCHYNLHGQIVTIDERLGFPICRCPECGKFHPAGTGVTASSVWVRRFATLLLFTWVAMVLTGFLGTVFVFLPLQTWSVSAYAHMDERRVPSGVPRVMTSVRWVFYLYPWNQDGTAEQNGIVTMRCICAASLVVGFIAGVLCVTLLWHWPRLRYLWALILPLLSLAILVPIFRSMPEYEFIQDQCLKRFIFQAEVQCAGILLGLCLGRKISRVLVRMIIPPKPRQALAFLWTVDGLKS